MPIKSRYTRILVGTNGNGNAWDFSGVSNSLDVEVSSEKLEDTTFQSARTFLAGSSAGNIAQAGYYDNSGANTFEQEIAESVINDELLYVAALFGTETAACAAYVAPQTSTENMAIGTPVAELITLSGGWGAGTGLKRGVRLFSGTISATGAQTGVDLGVAGTTGGQAWLFVTAVTGTATNATFTVQSATTVGFGSPATEGTFTFTGRGAFAIALSGTVDRYVRLNATGLGGATNITATAIIAVNGVTQ